MTKSKKQGEKGISLREDAYGRILSAIIFGDLAPGTAADEKHLATRFDVGLAAVRDALYRLSLEGMVERQPRIGTRIPDLGLRELQDVFEARILLEGSCAALCAHRATPHDVAAMEAAFVGFEDAIRRHDFRELVRMDQRFHRTMAAATHNQQLEKQITLLHNNASRFWYFGLSRLDSRALFEDIKGHLDVIKFIKKGNAAAAERCMRGVLGHFPDNVRFFLTGTMSFKEGKDERVEFGGRERKRPQKSVRTIPELS